VIFTSLLGDIRSNHKTRKTYFRSLYLHISEKRQLLELS